MLELREEGNKMCQRVLGLVGQDKIVNESPDRKGPGRVGEDNGTFI
jgi:hypothetical protein